jgi:hypothetical protein
VIHTPGLVALLRTLLALIGLSLQPLRTSVSSRRRLSEDGERTPATRAHNGPEDGGFDAALVAGLYRAIQHAMDDEEEDLRLRGHVVPAFFAGGGAYEVREGR